MKKGGKFSVISAEHAAVPFRSPTVRVHSCRFGFQAKRDASTAMIDTSSRPLHKASITNIAFLSFLFALTGPKRSEGKKQESETTSISACNLPPPQSAEWVLPVRETCIFYFIRSSDPDQGRLAKAEAFASSSVISKRDCRRVKESRLDNIDIR